MNNGHYCPLFVFKHLTCLTQSGLISYFFENCLFLILFFCENKHISLYNPTKFINLTKDVAAELLSEILFCSPNQLPEILRIDTHVDILWDQRQH